MDKKKSKHSEIGSLIKYLGRNLDVIRILVGAELCSFLPPCKCAQAFGRGAWCDGCPGRPFRPAGRLGWVQSDRDHVCELLIIQAVTRASAKTGITSRQCALSYRRPYEVELRNGSSPVAVSADVAGTSPGPNSPESCRPASSPVLSFCTFSDKSENWLKPADQPF